MLVRKRSPMEVKLKLDLQSRGENSMQEITLMPHTTIEESVQQLIISNRIPAYHEPHLLEMVTDGIGRLIKQNPFVESPMKDFEEHQANVKDNSIQVKFSHAFAQLAQGKAFDKLLSTEEEYSTESSAIHINKSDAIIDLNSRFNFSDSLPVTDRRRFPSNEMFQNYTENIGIINATFDSQLEDVFTRQRFKYREFVLNLFEKKSDEQVKQEETPPSLPKRKPMDPKVADIVKSLSEMGFESDKALCAALMSDINMDKALVLLLEDSAGIEKAIKDGYISSFNSSGASSSPSRQQQVKVERNRSSSSQATANFKRLNDWFKSQVDDAINPNLSDNFTVVFGSHVRSTFNLALHTGHCIDALKFPSDAGALKAIHAQTLASLYSKSLNGLVLLVPCQDFVRYKTGLAANSELFQLCKRSAELHFLDLETQIRMGEDLFYSQQTGVCEVQEGDFLVTKHSNLPGIHVIFHFFINVSDPIAELSQRSPCIVGLRNLFRMSMKYDIHNLTLPLLLLPECAPKDNPQAQSQLAIITSKALSKSASLQALAQFASSAMLGKEGASSLQNNTFMPISTNKVTVYHRRAEIVLKTLKAHLIETSQGASRKAEDSLPSTAQFKFYLTSEQFSKAGDQQYWSSLVEMIRLIFRTL